MALLLDKYFLKLPIALYFLFLFVPLPELVLLFLRLKVYSLFRPFHFLLPLLSFSATLAKSVLAVVVLWLSLPDLPVEFLFLWLHFHPDWNPILFLLHHLNLSILTPDFLPLPFHLFPYQILYFVLPVLLPMMIPAWYDFYLLAA